VLRANWHEPGLNPTYQDFASHYGTAILPARPRRPRNKAPFDRLKVRGRGPRAGRRVRLRNQRFFSLAELNAAIRAFSTISIAGPCVISGSVGISCSTSSIDRRSARCQSSPRLRMSGRHEQYELFEAAPGGEPVTVRPDLFRLDRMRQFGDVWLGLRLWQALALDELCGETLACGRERVPWSTMAAIQVIARLCEPSSELHIAEDWYRQTTLSDLLGVPAGAFNDDRLYRALDRLLPHKPAHEAHLKRRLGELFELDNELLLYDVTSTYFEGQANANPLAARGHSRDHRPDCKQVCIGLVVTRQGMPLGYEVFAGNRTDVTTVEEIVGTMEARYGRAHRIWVMDRGMTSAETVAWLQHSQRRYLIGANRNDLRILAPQLADARDWQPVRDGVEAKLCTSPDGEETFLLVRSAERQNKERAMHARFCQRIEAALQSLEGRLARAKRPIDRAATERQIGRLLRQAVVDKAVKGYAEDMLGDVFFENRGGAVDRAR